MNDIPERPPLGYVSFIQAYLSFLGKDVVKNVLITPRIEEKKLKKNNCVDTVARSGRSPVFVLNVAKRSAKIERPLFTA